MKGTGFSSDATQIQTFKTKSGLLKEYISTFVLLLTLLIVVFRADHHWEPSWSLCVIQKSNCYSDPPWFKVRYAQYSGFELGIRWQNLQLMNHDSSAVNAAWTVPVKDERTFIDVFSWLTEPSAAICFSSTSVAPCSHLDLRCETWGGGLTPIHLRSFLF